MNERIKMLLGIDVADTSKDVLIDYLIEDAIDEVVLYCNLKSYEVRLNSIVIKMVLQNYNKAKIQGITSQTYSGVSETYTDGYTQDIMTQLNQNRRVKFL